MKVSVLNMAGDEVGTIELSPAVFEQQVNRDLMHQALVRQLANKRQGTHKTKTRAEVNRTGAKWYRQKGTGRARHGSKRAPIFVGGGIAHGPQPRSYEKDMPRKMRRAALRSALTVKAQGGDIVVLDRLELDQPKTKEMVGVVRRLVGDGSALVLMAERDDNVEKSARNLPDVKTLRATYLNIRDLLGHDKLIMPLAALEVLEGFLGDDLAVAAGMDEEE
ncbi:MAG: 50S ribosomal protein L4 [Chloroflexi bacterium]|nr:50S ribosomal protein L4 [Chloroflexota bacterium]MCI0580497.1 50S ribosomal protein L4 [Chloroflexota bacterium]MCI0649241.1 50S ribosomal protein L4 [Chloroflexota bacterium]MCI0727947.1 50S ribosomal protein L4 [Chloroflexota bacterium]